MLIFYPHILLLVHFQSGKTHLLHKGFCTIYCNANKYLNSLAEIQNTAQGCPQGCIKQTVKHNQ